MTRSQSPTPSDRSGAPVQDGDRGAPRKTGTTVAQPDPGESPETAVQSNTGQSAKTAAGAGEAAAAAEARRDAARRRRRIDEVFGDVLPATTRDERESGHRGGFSLEHYRSSRPPHWGDKQ